MKKVIAFFFACLFVFSLVGCKCGKENYRTFGVWWWDDTLDNSYLEFAKDNGVNEIYYCSSAFNDKTDLFIQEANRFGIKVYYLAGEYKWLTDSSKLYSRIDKYVNYQNTYNNKFSGIHLDIEPHQDPSFSVNREKLITNFISLANDLKKKYSNITFDYDLPFWLDDFVTFNGVNKEAYKHMIDVADRVFLMSYRDSAAKIYDVSKEEIEYAKSINKVVVLGVETKSNEGDNVSFQEEGKVYMDEELNKLREMLPSEFGITIHHIKTWYDLKE